MSLLTLRDTDKLTATHVVFGALALKQDYDQPPVP